MSRYSKEDIIKMVKEDDVEFIRMQFTDIFGQLKNVAITASQVEKAVAGSGHVRHSALAPAAGESRPPDLRCVQPGRHPLRRRSPGNAEASDEKSRRDGIQL